MATGSGQAGRRSPRARGEGSIIFYGGRYGVRIRWRGREGTWFAPSKAEAVALLRQKLRERDLTPAPVPTRLLLDAWLDEWLAQVALARPRTYPAYVQKAAHLRAKLGNHALAAIDARDIRLALAELSEAGMSPTMLQHVFRTLSTALTVAARERRIERNPCRDVATPRRAEFEASTLTVEQAQRLVEIGWDTKLGPLIVVALSTGMRAGELMALTWHDVEPEGQITVNKSVHWQAHGNHVAGPPKTRSGRRTIRIDALAVDALESQRSRVTRMRLLAPKWEDHNLVFPNIRGGYWVPSGAFVREFRAILSRADCPRIRFHDLRHTAGLFLTRSVGLVVTSRMLGHSDPSITAKFYGHAASEDFSAAARAMSVLLQGSGSV